MQKFNIGDIVKAKDNNSILFIVVDMLDFTKATNNISDIDYEMMQIYPVRRISKYATLSEGDIELHLGMEDLNSEMLMRFIAKERRKMGWLEEPDFLIAVRESLRFKSLPLSRREYDIIRYDLINSVDECLDAIRDLNRLHEEFGDEAYLQLKEVVFKRIKELI